MLRLLGLQFTPWTLVLVGGDIGVFLLAAVAILGLIANPALLLPWQQSQNMIALSLFLGIHLITLYVADLYDQYQDYASSLNVSRLIFTVWVATLLAVFFFRYSPWLYLGRRFIEWQGVAFGVGLALWRISFSALALPTRLRRRLLIIGAGVSGRCISEAVRRRPNSGLEVVGWVDDDPSKADRMIDGAPVLGNSEQLPQLVKQYKIDMVVLAITQGRSPALLTTLSRMAYNSVQLIDMPTLYETVAGKIPIAHISEIWLFLHSVGTRKMYYRKIKRLLDLGLAAMGLVLTWPLFLILAMAIKLDSAGPVFYRQKRSGQDDHPFTIYKFRTMVEDAEANGPQFSGRNDPRITRVGKILRKLRLDELPQLINILKGEMSLVGPRPERPNYILEYQEVVPQYRPGSRAGDPPGYQVVCGYKERLPFYSFRGVVRPGVTGWAQVMHGYTATLEETAEKLQYDLYYIKNMSFFLDVAILLKTIRILLLGRGR